MVRRHGDSILRGTSNGFAFPSSVVCVARCSPVSGGQDEKILLWSMHRRGSGDDADPGTTIAPPAVCRWGDVLSWGG